MSNPYVIHAPCPSLPKIGNEEGLRGSVAATGQQGRRRRPDSRGGGERATVQVYREHAVVLAVMGSPASATKL